MVIVLVFVLVIMIVAAAVLIAQNRRQKDTIEQMASRNEKFAAELSEMIKSFHSESREDYSRAQSSQREEIAGKVKDLREEVAGKIKDFSDSFNTSVKLLTESQKSKLESLEKIQGDRLKSMELTQGERLKSLEEMQKERLSTLDKSQGEMVKKTDEKLENIRRTVEEKLDKTLTERLGKSFETVGKQLGDVQKGLGEMKSLAEDVGGLKKVLSNVKMRGGMGEVQLKMLLDEYLAPGQFEANVHTKPGSKEVVEYAVKFQGPQGKDFIWLPIDSKFPKDRYDQLVAAYDSGDKEAIDSARKDLANAIKLNAKDIRDKYLEVPYTTRFGIMFLPFEGLYAEVVRDNSLLDQIQREYGVSVAGPTNLAALLTSFQLGFQTLAIQKRGDEVWKVLGAVKGEFSKFGGMLEKAKGKIQGGLNDIDKLVTTRTNVINRRLKDVSELDGRTLGSGVNGEIAAGDEVRYSENEEDVEGAEDAEDAKDSEDTEPAGGKSDY